MDYKDAWDYQQNLFDEIVEIKKKNRKNNSELITPNYFLFVEHPHVYTLGKSGNMSNLLIDENQLKSKNASFYKINRGGDITYHGPGQIVGYPILDLENFFTDIHKYLRLLEETVINTLKIYGVEGERNSGKTGVWLDVESPFPRKICAMGVRASRWVTMHGFALNVDVNLEYFNNIIPCGLANNIVTSLKKELGDKDINIKGPHVGWNECDIINKNQLFHGIKNNSDFYFTHSYYLKDWIDFNNITLYNVSKKGCYSNRIPRINFDSIFKRWIENCVPKEKKSLLVGLSCSGTSKNIINAFEYGKYLGYIFSKKYFF